MESGEPQKIQVTLNPDGVIAPLSGIIAQSSTNVLFGLQLLESVDSLVHPRDIKTEDTFFTFQFDDPSQDVSIKKDNFKLWILQKGVEDLIKGINLSLIEAYFFITLVTKSTDIKTMQDLQKEIEQLRETAFKQSLPGLFAKVKPGLTGDLIRENEINSLNKLRNCLIHRNGVVTEHDINDDSNKQLKVFYTRMRIFYEKEGQEIDVKKNEVVSGPTELKLRMMNECFVFNLGEHVKINFKEFNYLLTTCTAFGQDLVQKLPKIIPAK